MIDVPWNVTRFVKIVCREGLKKMDSIRVTAFFDESVRLDT